MLSQHPAQPHQPCCTASTADYLILCLLTHLSLSATRAAKVGRGLSGDVTHALAAIFKVHHWLSNHQVILQSVDGMNYEPISFNSKYFDFH